MMVGHEKLEGRGGRRAPEDERRSLATLPDTGRAQGAGADALTAG